MLRPATALLNRMRFAQKFLLIGLVLLVPLTWVSWGFASQQARQRDFSAKELIGTEYVAPAMRLLSGLTAARSAAVAAAAKGDPIPAPSPDLLSAAGSLQALDQRHGRALQTTTAWNALRSQIEAVVESPPRDGLSAFDRYSEITAGLQSLIITAGNESNLILDPDLDSFYLMETLITRLPTLVEDAGRTVDILRLAGSASPAGDARAASVEFTLRQASVTTNADAVSSNLATAIAQTGDRELAGDVAAAAEALEAARNEYTAALADARMGKAPDAAVSSERLRAATLSMYEATVPALNRLVATRIAGFARTQRSIVIGAVLGIVVATYLFLGLYSSLTKSVQAMVRGAGRLASGDLTQPVERLTRDELADVSAGMNAAVDRMRTALTVIAGHAKALASASRQVNGVSIELAGLAQQTSDQAKDVTAAAEDVAQQVQLVVTVQLAASMSDFAQTAATTTRVLDSANAAVHTVTSTGEMVTRLGESGAEIGEVMRFITGIAAQTHLLALNATIEAARAGDAGTGFAVVAHEVKQLARETAEAADSIRARITAIQTDTTAAIAASSAIRGEIEDIRENQLLVAVAMEEQTANAGEIRRALDEAVARSGAIARDVSGFNAAAGRTTTGVCELEVSASAMAAIAGELEELVDRFEV